MSTISPIDKLELVEMVRQIMLGGRVSLYSHDNKMSLFKALQRENHLGVVISGTVEGNSSAIFSVVKKPKYTYDYPMAALAVDCVVVRNISFDEFEVLLLTRESEPFSGTEVLPGGFVEVDEETSKEAAVRELREETGLVPTVCQSLGFFDTVDRDPRYRVVSFPYLCVVLNDKVTLNEEASKYRWVNIGLTEDIEQLNLGFDHKQILHAAKVYIKNFLLK